ncbi:hypothetical protein MJO28_002257 [Puccinia striiformis f. sp. tritici]|uniref:Uncharacterized protein n=1 Tax=Puccinia striiformis f. sp. tritici TaxID=168172 RepID=A0ACC0EVV6_9BASI|nr:hypothetical protein MJO28_002257 [Puccinia striiformis f. sp. tritici]KAI7966594.1 hypothetical protein MJO29_002342 [Puccinia striiformis f. sp. tritici]
MSSAAPTNNEATRTHNTSPQIRKRSRSPSGASVGTVQKRQNLESGEDPVVKQEPDLNQTDAHVGMTSSATAAGPGAPECKSKHSHFSSHYYRPLILDHHHCDDHILPMSGYI